MRRILDELDPQVKKLQLVAKDIEKASKGGPDGMAEKAGLALGKLNTIASALTSTAFAVNKSYRKTKQGGDAQGAPKATVNVAEVVVPQDDGTASRLNELCNKVESLLQRKQHTSGKKGPAATLSAAGLPLGTCLRWATKGRTCDQGDACRFEHQPEHKDKMQPRPAADNKVSGQARNSSVNIVNSSDAPDTYGQSLLGILDEDAGELVSFARVVESGTSDIPEDWFISPEEIEDSQSAEVALDVAAVPQVSAQQASLEVAKDARQAADSEARLLRDAADAEALWANDLFTALCVALWANDVAIDYRYLRGQIPWPLGQITEFVPMLVPSSPESVPTLMPLDALGQVTESVPMLMPSSPESVPTGYQDQPPAIGQLMDEHAEFVARVFNLSRGSLTNEDRDLLAIMGRQLVATRPMRMELTLRRLKRAIMQTSRAAYTRSKRVIKSREVVPQPARAVTRRSVLARKYRYLARLRQAADSGARLLRNAADAEALWANDLFTALCVAPIITIDDGLVDVLTDEVWAKLGLGHLSRQAWQESISLADLQQLLDEAEVRPTYYRRYSPAELNIPATEHDEDLSSSCCSSPSSVPSLTASSPCGSSSSAATAETEFGGEDDDTCYPPPSSDRTCFFLDWMTKWRTTVQKLRKLEATTRSWLMMMPRPYSGVRLTILMRPCLTR